MGTYLRKYFSGLKVSGDEPTAKRVRDLRIKAILLLLSIAYFAFMMAIGISREKYNIRQEQINIDNAFKLMREFDELEGKIVELDTDSLMVFADNMLFNPEYELHEGDYLNYYDANYMTFVSYSFYTNYVEPLLNDLKNAISIEQADAFISRMQESDKRQLLQGAPIDLSKYGVVFLNQKKIVAEALETHFRNIIVMRLRVVDSGSDRFIQ